MTADLVFTADELAVLQKEVDEIEAVPLRYGKEKLKERFSAAEYHGRRAKLRAAMKEKGLDIVLLASPESQCWLHGYQARWYRTGSTTEWPPTNYTAFRALTGEIIVFDTPDHQWLMESYIFVDNAVSSDGIESDNGVTIHGIATASADPNLEKVHTYILDHLQEKGWFGSSKCGLELWSPRHNAATTGHLVTLLKDKFSTEIEDVSVILRLLQLTKSEEEQQVIRDAARILDSGYEHLQSTNIRWSPAADPLKVQLSSLNKDMTEIQVWAEMEWAMAQQGGETSGLHNTVSRTRNFCHSLSTMRPVGEGPLLLDPSAVKHRYHANTARQLYVGGKPSKELAKASFIAAGAIKVLDEVAQLGIPFSVVNEALRDYYRKAGIWDFRDWIGGYQIGIAFTPDWVGEFTWNADAEGEDAETHKIIEKGMVTNFESFVGGAGSIDTIIFKEKGVEVVSKLPQTIYIVDEQRYIDESDL